MTDFKSFFVIYDKSTNKYLTFTITGDNVPQRKFFGKKSTAMAAFRQYCKINKKQGNKIDVANYELIELKPQEIGRYPIV